MIQKTAIVIMVAIAACESRAQTVPAVILDIHHALSLPPPYFGLERGSMSSVGTRDQLYAHISHKSNNLFKTSIGKYDHYPISELIDVCNYIEPDPYSGIEPIANAADSFFQCYEEKLRQKSNEITTLLIKANQSAYALAVVFWGTNWKSNKRLDMEEPTSHWRITQAFLISKKGILLKSSPSRYAYAYGYDHEHEQRDPARYLFPLLADDIISHVRLLLAQSK